MRSVPWLLNTAWMLKCSAEAARFAGACRRVAETQTRLLLQTLQANRDCEFGRRYRFETITNARTYQERVPLATYDDFAASIGRIAAGESNILTSAPVCLLEPTSGTAAGEKLIPYTEGLRRQFQRGVAAWIANLFHQRPAVRCGRAYWSISPSFGPPRQSPGGLPIGFDDDSAYLGWTERFALRRLLVAPPEMARLTSMDSFRYCTLLFLLAADDLAFISVWSPTYLIALLGGLAEWQERLCHDVRHGTLNPPTPIAEESARALRRWLRPDAKRADRLSRLLTGPVQQSERFRSIWPRLSLVSCWADGWSAGFLPELRSLLPGIELQPKGLLATEGFVSFPRVDSAGSALALRCHFFEFEELAGGKCRLAHELDRGGHYGLVLTTAGGLYRYRLRDEVQVVGYEYQCPLLRFIGKTDAISDLVGEKLGEPHVRTVLDQLMAAHDFSPRFAMLVPIQKSPACYRLYLQGPGITADAGLISRLRQGLDERLMENPYYRHARAVGQLAAAEAVALEQTGTPAWLLYERRCMEEGQKCGNIKPMALDRRLGWDEVFASGEDRSTTCHK